MFIHLFFGGLIMYDLIPFFLGGMMFLLGLFMFISPVKATKEEFRNDEKKVSNTKKSGIIVVFCGIAVIAIGIMRLM
jgi:hypothetical protein